MRPAVDYVGHHGRVFGGGIGRVAFVCVIVACSCTGSSAARLDERGFPEGADGEHLTTTLVVDAHVIGQSDTVGDCGPLGEHTASCQGPGSVQLAVSLLNTGTGAEVVPVFEARCDDKHAANGTAPSFKTGDTVRPGERRTDTVTFDLSNHRCPIPVFLMYRPHPKDGDPAIAVPLPAPI